MKFLQMVKEKQAAYDNIFEPLQEIIDVLTTYNVEIPEKSIEQLQELPERWVVSSWDPCWPGLPSKVGEYETSCGDGEAEGGSDARAGGQETHREDRRLRPQAKKLQICLKKKSIAHK